jgi:hypothetical protein
MVIFEVFVFAFRKDISNGSPILCEFFYGCYRHDYYYYYFMVDGM